MRNQRHHGFTLVADTLYLMMIFAVCTQSAKCGASHTYTMRNLQQQQKIEKTFTASLSTSFVHTYKFLMYYITITSKRQIYNEQFATILWPNGSYTFVQNIEVLGILYFDAVSIRLWGIIQHKRYTATACIFITYYFGLIRSNGACHDRGWSRSVHIHQHHNKMSWVSLQGNNSIWHMCSQSTTALRRIVRR